MPRALEQIIKELNSVYNPQRDVYNKSLQAMPQQQEGELRGLEAAKDDSFDQIVTGANRRGVAFGGIPLEEQAKYLDNTFLPSVVNLKSRYGQQGDSLRLALAQVGIDQRKHGQDMWDREYQREEAEKQRVWERQQAERNAAEARAAANRGIFTGGGGDGGGGGGGSKPISLETFLAQRYKQQPTANRQTQDAWVAYWMRMNNMDPQAKGDPTGTWNAYNSIYPWQKYNDQVRKVGPDVRAKMSPNNSGSVQFTQSILGR
jgi:hypothetical protein